MSYVGIILRTETMRWKKLILCTTCHKKLVFFSVAPHRPDYKRKLLLSNLSVGDGTSLEAQLVIMSILLLLHEDLK